MVFNENTNNDFILLSKQGRTQLVYSSELTTEHIFAKFGGGIAQLLSRCAGSASKTCQYHLEQWFSNFMSRGPLQKTLNTYGPLLINNNT